MHTHRNFCINAQVTARVYVSISVLLCMYECVCNMIAGKQMENQFGFLFLLSGENNFKITWWIELNAIKWEKFRITTLFNMASENVAYIHIVYCVSVCMLLTEFYPFQLQNTCIYPLKWRYFANGFKSKTICMRNVICVVVLHAHVFSFFTNNSFLFNVCMF